MKSDHVGISNNQVPVAQLENSCQLVLDKINKNMVTYFQNYWGWGAQWARTPQSNLYLMWCSFWKSFSFLRLSS